VHNAIQALTSLAWTQGPGLELGRKAARGADRRLGGERPKVRAAALKHIDKTWLLD
jgi:hypothetical protein